MFGSFNVLKYISLSLEKWCSFVMAFKCPPFGDGSMGSFHMFSAVGGKVVSQSALLLITRISPSRQAFPVRFLRWIFLPLEVHLPFPTFGYPEACRREEYRKKSRRAQ